MTAGRLPAAERRRALLDVAARTFARGSYRGTTTAEIAREAGVTEPILYRHFESKRALFLACLDDAWKRVRGLWDEAVAAEPDPGRWLSAMGAAFLAAGDPRVILSSLWVQSLAEAGEDEEIARALREQVYEVHGVVAEVVRRAQTAGAVLPERDPEVEAWTFLSLGLLAVISERLGELAPVFPAIMAARRTWMTGKA